MSKEIKLDSNESFTGRQYHSRSGALWHEVADSDALTNSWISQDAPAGRYVRGVAHPDSDLAWAADLGDVEGIAEQVLVTVNLQVIHALTMELVTGMKLSNRGSALQAAKIQHIVPEKCRSKRGALDIAIAKMKELRPDYTPSASVTRALQK